MDQVLLLCIVVSHVHEILQHGMPGSRTCASGTPAARQTRVASSWLASWVSLDAGNAGLAGGSRCTLHCSSNQIAGTKCRRQRFVVHGVSNFPKGLSDAGQGRPRGPHPTPGPHRPARYQGPLAGRIVLLLVATRPNARAGCAVRLLFASPSRGATMQTGWTRRGSLRGGMCKARSNWQHSRDYTIQYTLGTHCTASDSSRQ